MNIENVQDERGNLLAIIVYSWVPSAGAQFFTPPEAALQVGALRYTKGKRIEPHVHRKIERVIPSMTEVLFIRSGRVQCDFYGAETADWSYRRVSSGDVVILFSGGHGFTMLEDSEIWEVKQGPYLPDDKTFLL